MRSTPNGRSTLARRRLTCASTRLARGSKWYSQTFCRSMVRVHLAGVPHQVLEQAELERLQPDPDAGPGHGAPLRVELEVGDAQDRLPPGGRRAADQGVEPRHEL